MRNSALLNTGSSCQGMYVKEHKPKPGALLPPTAFGLSKIIVMRTAAAFPILHPNAPSSMNVTKSVPDKELEPSVWLLTRELTHRITLASPITTVVGL